jgi:hypothetical protein
MSRLPIVLQHLNSLGWTLLFVCLVAKITGVLP